MLANFQALFETWWPLLAVGLVGAAIFRAARQVHDDAHFDDHPTDVVPEEPIDARSDDGPWPYRPRTVLTEAEQELFGRLREAFPQHLVLAQVQMSTALHVTAPKHRRAWLNRIIQKSFDFVVCDRDAMPLLAIELDDSSHRREDRKRADQTKNRACHDGGLHLIRYFVTAMPSVEELRTSLTSGGPSPQMTTGSAETEALGSH